MKNQNNIIIFLAFLIILLLIPTVCASDLNNAVDPISLSSADADTTVSMQSGSSDVDEVTNSPLSLAKADNSTVELDSNHVLKATNNDILAADSGSFSQLKGLIDSTSAGGTLELNKSYINSAGDTAITIGRGITIDGKGFSIDASGKSRIFTTSAAVNNLILKNIVFKNANFNGNGGALYFGSNLNYLVIENCTFFNCTATKHGSAIYFNRPVKNSNISAKFIDNRAENQATIYAGTSTVFDKCNFNLTFINNTSRQATGVKFYGDVTNSVFQLNLIGNKAVQYCSGVYLDQKAVNVNITGTFINNTAGQNGEPGSGGALYFRYPENVNIEGTFIGNKALTRYSGAIHFQDTAKSVNINGYFKDNYACFEGGAIYFNGPADDIHINGTFINNTADGIGGGAIEMTKNVINSIITGNFISNNGKNGSAIRMGQNSKGNTINAVFNDNSATLGTVYLNGSSDIRIKANFTGNVADYGGAIYSTGSEMMLSDSSFDGNKAINGSAIYLDGGSKLSADSVTFGDNQAYSYRLPIVYNTAHVGAVLYGGDNILNAIHNNCISSNVMIDGVAVVDGADKSQGGTVVYQDARERNQEVTLSIYDSSTDSTSIVEAVTDIYGKVSVPHGIKDDYWYIISENHSEDMQYTGIFNTTGIHITPGLNLLNHTMYEGSLKEQKLISGLFDENLTFIADASTVKYYVIVDGVYTLLGNSHTNGMGVSKIFESSVLRNLKSGKYTLFANYTNENGKYEICNTTATLTVLPRQFHVTKVLVNTEGIHLDDVIYFNITFYNDVDEEITKLYAVDDYPSAIEFNKSVKLSGWHFDGDKLVSDNPLPANSSVSLILPFKAAKIGNFANKVVMYANFDRLSNSSECNFEILPSPNMTVAKSLETKGTIYDISQIMFKVTVKNTGDIALKGAYIVDYENIAGLIFDRHSDGWTMTRMGDGRIKFSLKNTLGINETASIELYYNATKAGHITNNASALCEYPEVNVTDSADVEVIPYLPNLKITKHVGTTETKYVGNQIVYHISVENTGNAILDGVYFIEDAYTDGLVYNSFKNDVGTWIQTKLDSKRYKFTLNQSAGTGMRYSAYLYFNLTSSGFKNNTVVAGHNNTMNLANATCGVEVLPFRPSVSIEKDRLSNWEVLPNSLVRFVVEVTNTGNTDLRNFYFVEEFANGLVYVKSDRDKFWNAFTTSDGKLAFKLNHTFEMGETALIDVIFNATKLGNHTNKVVAYYSNASNLYNPVLLNTSSDWVYVNETVSPYPEGSNHNISVVKTLLTHGDIHLGDTVHYEIVVHNIGNATITDLELVDETYPNLKFSHWDEAMHWTLTQQGNRLTLKYNNDLPVRDYAKVILYFNVTKIANISNTVKASWNVGRNTTSYTTPDKEVLPKYDMIISKYLVNKGVIYEGDQVIFKIEIINIGDVDLNNAFFVDYKDIDGLVYDHFIYNEDCWDAVDSGGMVKFSLKHPLAIGENHVIELVYNATKPGNFTNKATAGCEDEDVNPSSSVKVEVLPYNPYVKIHKVLVSGDLVYAGNQVAYHITLENTGDVVLDNIYFIEDDYGDLVFDHFRKSVDNWTMEKLDGIRYKFTLNEKVAPGEDFGLTLYFNTTTAGFKNNTVISGFNGDMDCENTTCGVNVLPRNVAIDLEKIKYETDRIITVGELAKFRIVIINEGNIALDNVYFIENIPDGLEYLYSDQNVSWTVSKISDNKYKFTYGRTLIPNDMATILLVFNTTSEGVKNNTVTGGYDNNIELANASDYINVTDKHVPDVEGDNSNITVEKYLLTQGRVYVGDKVLYEIRVHNIGDKHLESMELSIQELPCENLVYAGWESASSWIFNESTLTFTLNRSISVRGYAALHVYFNVTGPGAITNEVNATWNGGKNTTSVNATAKEVLPYEPNITATKVLVKDMAFVGDLVIYEVVIKNTGNVNLDSIFFIEKEWGDVLVFDHYATDDDWIYNETSNTFRLNYSLTDDDVSTVLLYFRAIAEGNIANSIAAGFNGTIVTNATSKNVTVMDKTINMTTTKISLERNGVIIGNQARFEFRIVNTGTVDLYNVFIREDNFSEGLVYDSIRSDVPWTYDASTKTFILDKLEAGDFTTVHLIFNTTATGLMTNNATYGYNDTVMGNAVAAVEVFDETPKISVEKITLTNNTQIGEDVLFKVNITNVGDFDIRNLTVVEIYSAGLELVSVEGAESWKQSKDPQGNDVFTYDGLFKAGQNAVLTFKFKSTVGGLLNNTVNVFADKLDSVTASNSTDVIHNSNITVGPVSGSPGKKVTITAVITDETGKPLPDGTATLSLNGVKYTADVSNGVVTFKGVVLPGPGNYTGLITYSGDNLCNPSETTIDVLVSKLDTTIRALDIVGYPGDVVDIVAVVLDENGNPVLSGIAILEVSDKIADISKSAAGEYTAKVVNGRAVFKNVVLSRPGIYKGYLSYLGDGIYSPSNNTMKITVLKVPVDISVEVPSSAKPGETVMITVKVIPKDDSIFNGIVDVVLPDGTVKKVKITDGFGTVSWTIPKDFNAGNYTIKVIFGGDDYYYSGNASTNMEVVKDNRSKPIKNETDDYKENKVAPHNIAKHETGNPIYILLVILSIMGLMPLRRK